MQDTVSPLGWEQRQHLAFKLLSSIAPHPSLSNKHAVPSSPRRWSQYLLPFVLFIPACSQGSYIPPQYQCQGPGNSSSHGAWGCGFVSMLHQEHTFFLPPPSQCQDQSPGPKGGGFSCDTPQTLWFWHPVLVAYLSPHATSNQGFPGAVAKFCFSLSPSSRRSSDNIWIILDNIWDMDIFL